MSPAPRKPAAARCPVCGARFRGTPECSRCGADLTALMRLAARASRLRQAAVAEMAAGNRSRAADLAGRASRLHATGGGGQLRRLLAWLP